MFFKSTGIKVLLMIIMIFSTVIGISLSNDNNTYEILTSQLWLNPYANDRVEMQTKLKQINGDLTEASESAAPPKTGSGVNLMLIAEMNEDYAKEMLTLYKDLQDGNLTADDSFIGVTTLLGMQVNETGTFDGVLPKTYLPYSNNKVVWNESYKGLTADQMTIRGFGNKEWNTISGGLCSWLSEGVDSASDRTPWCMQGSMITLAKANINGVTNASRSGSDSHYIPDNIASLNKRFDNFLKTYKVDSTELTEDGAALLASNIHNRGDNGALQCSFGMNYDPYGGTSGKRATQVYKNNANAVTLGMNNAASLISNYMSSSSNVSFSELTGSEYGRIIFAAIAAHTSNWYFSQDSYNYLSKKSSILSKTWKILYPNENISSSDMLKKIKSKVSNLNVAIKTASGESLTGEQTNSIYNTSTDYSDKGYSHSKGWGTVYCVSNSKIKYADGKNHTLVSAYDLVGGGYLISACILGKSIYARMLKVSGVDVDPTNPQTYLNDLNSTDSDTYLPGSSNISSNSNAPNASSNSQVTTWLTELGLSYSNLSGNQVRLMEGIYKNLGIDYLSCRHGNNCDGNCYDSNNPSHLDSATFVWRVYKDASLPIKSLTCANLAKNIKFERIAWNDRKAGDVLVTQGDSGNHAMIYIKDKNGKLTVAEARSGKKTQVTTLSTNVAILSDKTGTSNIQYYGKTGKGNKYILLRYLNL